MIKQKIAETFHEEPTDRFEIARHFQGLDVKSFLHYLLTLKEVHSRNELINFIKAKEHSGSDSAERYLDCKGT